MTAGIKGAIFFTIFQRVPRNPPEFGVSAVGGGDGTCRTEFGSGEGDGVWIGEDVFPAAISATVFDKESSFWLSSVHFDQQPSL